MTTFIFELCSLSVVYHVASKLLSVVRVECLRLGVGYSS